MTKLNYLQAMIDMRSNIKWLRKLRSADAHTQRELIDAKDPEEVMKISSQYFYFTDKQLVMEVLDLDRSIDNYLDKVKVNHERLLFPTD